ncbi:hypothetical protein HHI36_012356 [Cryptolaemus montrouzieri]|uniref:Major facilitator superfamily (MFS) profile domain-containing protein n=1 Tax=Cryptolaemus montrouzieri TaxID=559131 RepID=A0ABD2NEZ7_9CUCU
MEVSMEKIDSFKKTRTYISVLLGLFMVIGEGALAGWAPPALDALSKADSPLGRPLSKSEQGFLASISTPGSVFGALFATVLSQRFGKKPILLFQGIPSLIFFLIMMFGKSLLLFDIARFLSGISTGGIYTILPLYISELIEAENRGKYCAGFGVATNIGMLLSCVLGYSLPFVWFHLILSVIPITFLILFPLLALESPYYIIQTNPVEAERYLREIRGKENVSEEFQNMKESFMKASQNSSWNILETKAMRKAFILALLIMTLIITCGTSVFRNYMGIIFDEADFSWSTQTEMIIVSVIQLIVSGFAIQVIRRYGRKPLLTISFGGCGISLIPLGTYFFLEDNEVNVTAFGWVPLVSLVSFVIFTNIAAVPLGKPVLGEFIPLKTKNITMAISIIYGALGLFLTSLYFPDAVDIFGRGVCFWTFAGFSICGSVFIWFFMVETKGKTLEEIQDEMNGIKRSNFNENKSSNLE